MNRFHVNLKGEAGKCSARAGQCPFGGEQAHYRSMENAQQAFELSMAAESLPEPLTREDPFERLSDHFIRQNGHAMSSMGSLAGEERLTRLSLQMIEEADDEHEANLDRLAPHDREVILASYSSFHDDMLDTLNTNSLDPSTPDVTDDSVLAALRTLRDEVSQTAWVLHRARGMHGTSFEWEMPSYETEIRYTDKGEWAFGHGNSAPPLFKVSNGALEEAYRKRHQSDRRQVVIRNVG